LAHAGAFHPAGCAALCAFQPTSAWEQYLLGAFFDMRLKLQIEKADPKPLKRRVLGWAVAFAFVQIIIAPAVALAVANIYFIVVDKSLYSP
jgi:hypothetical protein